MRDSRDLRCVVSTPGGFIKVFSDESDTTYPGVSVYLGEDLIAFVECNTEEGNTIRTYAFSAASDTPVRVSYSDNVLVIPPPDWLGDVTKKY